MAKRTRSSVKRAVVQRIMLDESSSDSDGSYHPSTSQPKKRRSRLSVSPSPQASNTDTRSSSPSTTMSNGAAIPPSESSTKNDESTSRKPSEASVPVNGQMVGGPLEKAKRDQLEAAYIHEYVAYAYPRHSSFYSGRVATAEHRSKRCLDLQLPGEVSEGETDARTDYAIDGVLFILNESALVVWQGYKYPTWESKSILGGGRKKGPAVVEYNRRESIVKELSKFVFKGQTPWDGNKKYPHMMLVQTRDYGKYVKSPGMVYLTGLLKRERQINDFLDTVYGRDTDKTGASIIFVDWTGFEKSSIPTFEILTDCEMTPDVQALEPTFVSSKRGACTCTGSCMEGYNEKKCCSHKAESNIAYVNNKGQIGNTVHPKKSDLIGDVETSKDCVDVYECGDGCACEADSKNCNQRAVQFGSQLKLTVFRHLEKGWTVHAGCDIESGTFVVEYTGIMMTAAEALNHSDRTYQIDIAVMVPSKRWKGKFEERTLVIDAKKKGSIARYISHSCEPNLFSYRVHFDIEGRPKRHIGLFAGRFIKDGEELSYNYWTDISDPEEFHRLTLEMGFVCKCGSDDCREKLYQKQQRQKENNEKAKKVVIKGERP